MAYKALDADDIKPTWGTFRMVRHELGGTAFGLNQIDFPPGKVGLGARRGAVGPGGDLLLHLAAAARSRSTARRSRCAPGATSSSHPTRSAAPTAGEDGLSFICVGGVPGGVYEPWAPPEE